MTQTEMLVLLSLQPEKGRLRSAFNAMNIAGSLLIELSLRGRLTLDEKNRVQVLVEPPLGDPLLDESLASIAASRKARKLASWIQRLPSALKPLKQRALRPLVDRGLLREERHKWLGLIPYRRYPMPEPSERDRLLEAVLRLLREQPREGDPPVAPLLPMLHASGDLSSLLPKELRRGLGRRVKKIEQSDAVIGAAPEALRAAQQAAAMAAITAATITTTTSSGS